MVGVIEGLTEDWRRLDQRVAELSNEIEELAKRDPACVRLMSVPGIGPIISSAMVAAIGSGDGFFKGRDFAAWLGLVPIRASLLASAIASTLWCSRFLAASIHGLSPWPSHLLGLTFTKCDPGCLHE
jgi:transposase